MAKPSNNKPTIESPRTKAVTMPDPIAAIADLIQQVRDLIEEISESELPYNDATALQVGRFIQLKELCKILNPLEKEQENIRKTLISTWQQNRNVQLGCPGYTLAFAERDRDGYTVAAGTSVFVNVNKMVAVS
jgi:uncharacterized NAD(P)/FAD-binding protein YdhS